MFILTMFILTGLFSLLMSMITGFLSFIVPIIMISLVLIIAITLLAVVVVTYVLDCYTTYAIAKRAGYAYAWLAWLPYLSTFVLIQVRGDKPVTLIKKDWVVEDRLRFGLLDLYFTKLMLRPLNILAKAGPVFAALITPVDLFARAVMGHINYVIYRDLLGLFRDDDRANHASALFLAICDAVLNMHLVRAIYLLFFLNKTKQDSVADAAEVVVADAAEVEISADVPETVEA